MYHKLKINMYSSTTKGQENYEFIFKVLLLGNSNVGKSSLFLRFVDDIWNDTFVPTIGVDFKIKTFLYWRKKDKNANMGYSSLRAF